MKNVFHNWSDIRIFLAVLRTGSTLAASKKLGMSQPTVARRIEALEHALKLTLFDRDTRGFRPTKDSERLSSLAASIEAAVEAFALEAEKSRRTKLRPIRITAPRVNFSANFAAIQVPYASTTGCGNGSTRHGSFQRALSEESAPVVPFGPLRLERNATIISVRRKALQSAAEIRKRAAFSLAG